MIEQLLDLGTNEHYVFSGCSFRRSDAIECDNDIVFNTFRRKTGVELPVKIKRNKIFLYNELFAFIVKLNGKYRYWTVHGEEIFDSAHDVFSCLTSDLLKNVLFFPLDEYDFYVPCEHLTFSLKCTILTNGYYIDSYSDALDLLMRHLHIDADRLGRLMYENDAGLPTGTFGQLHAFIDWVNRSFSGRDRMFIDDGTVYMSGETIDIVQSRFGGWYLDFDFYDFLKIIGIDRRSTFIKIANGVLGKESVYHGVFPEFSSKEDLLKVLYNILDR